MNRQTQTNQFLHSSNETKNINLISPNAVSTQASNIAFSGDNYNSSPSNNGNRLEASKTDSKNTESSSSPRPITQTSYTPSPNIPVFDTPAAANDFTTSRTATSPKFHPPPSYSPSLQELIPLKISPARTISEQKCEEYVEEIAGAVYVSALTGTSNTRKVINSCTGTNRLVVGGTMARVGEFPHMVALGTYNSNQKFTLICGGTLISHTWVLTAAHCSYGPKDDPKIEDARIGFHNLTDHEGVRVAVKDIITHSDYNPPEMYADIALVQLMNDVTFSKFIRPACLYQIYDSVPRQAWVSGWGVTEYSGEVSDQLLKAQLNLVDTLVCSIKHNSSLEVPYGITPSMICAGDPSGTSDTCQGDSGGPLQILSSNKCVFLVIGITSFGQGCAMIDIPGVYTRVSHYLPWIENTVWPKGQ